MIETLVDSFDIWGTALTQKSLGKKAGIDNISLQGITRLRELILKLAVRGKLVPQLENDEPSKSILKEIAKYDEIKFTKSAGSRRIKTIPDTVGDDIKFEVPDGWEWTKVSKIFEIQDSLRIPVNSKDRANRVGPYPYYGANGQVGFIDDYIFDGERILIAEDGGFFNDPIRGVAYIVNGKYWVNNHAHVLKVKGKSQSKFFVLFFNQMNWNPLVRGMTRDKLNQATLINIPIVLPPLAEQHRIVAKVDELTALCDKLEQQQMNHIETHLKLVEALLQPLIDAISAKELKTAWQHLEPHFDILFTTEESIDLLKQTILQLAVMGKLVPQDPNDEPASVLLKKIEAEKNKLIKEGKLKKQNPLPEITEDEKPFELPESWEWSRLGDVITLKSGQDLTPKDYSDTVEVGLPYITGASNLENERVIINRWTNSPKSIAFKGDLLLTCKGSGVGKMGWLHVLEAHIARQIMAVNTVVSDLQFIKIILEANLSYIKSSANGLIPGIDRKTVLEMVSALPPENEQNRIVAKVDELMGLCDQLKERIVATQELKVKLADAVVERAVN